MSVLAAMAIAFGMLSLIPDSTPKATAAPAVCATVPTPLVAGRFVSCWDTQNTSTGSSDDSSVWLPLVDPARDATVAYNFTVDWGDGSPIGTVTSWNDSDASHTYSTPGQYWITIEGTFRGFSFGGTGQSGRSKDRLKLIDVAQWGPLSLGNFGEYFADAGNVNFTATDSPDLSVTSNFNAAFQGATVFNSPIGHWDISNVTSAYAAFGSALAFNQPLSGWDDSTGGISQMAFMFFSALAFDQDIGGWDTSNVNEMYWMFFGASSFDNAGAPMVWDVGRVTNFSNMFEAATEFNRDIGDWDMSRAPGSSINMHSMFHNATSFNRDLSRWDMSAVVSTDSMFRFATSFNNGGQALSWDDSMRNVTNMGAMFRGASTFNQPINSWNTGSVTNMSEMFQDATAFNQPLGAWDTGNVTNMRGMFHGATAFNQPLGFWSTNGVTDMRQMFKNASTFDQSLSNWIVTSVDDTGGMDEMFAGVTLSSPIYSALLISWSGQPVKPNVTFDGGGSRYTSSAGVARAALITDDSWVITDGGPLTVPGAPTAVAGTPAGGDVSLSWTAPASTGGTPITGYVIEWSDDSDSGPWDDSVAVGSVLSTTVTGLARDDTFYFRVSASNMVGTGVPSAVSAPVYVAPSPSSDSPPDVVVVSEPPTDVRAVAGNGSATVTWNAPTQTGSFPVSHYRVTASPGTGTCLTTATSCVIERLTRGVPYTFTVSVLTGAGWSLPSSPSSPLVWPITPDRPSIVIKGACRSDGRLEVQGRIRGASVDEVAPRVTFREKSLQRSGRPVPVATDGTFTWERRLSRAAVIAFTTGDLVSNEVAVGRGGCSTTR